MEQKVRVLRPDMNVIWSEIFQAIGFIRLAFCLIYQELNLNTSVFWICRCNTR